MFDFKKQLIVKNYDFFPHKFTTFLLEFHNFIILIFKNFSNVTLFSYNYSLTTVMS